jgi:serine/threonine-protein kinase
MGRVYKAEHVEIGRTVAIKLLEPVVDVPHAAKRFLREARATANLRHPNIVEVLDFGRTEAGAPFLVMEFLDGRDLATILREDGPLPWHRTRHYLAQLCAGLAKAHDAGLIHRDLKLENCIIVAGDVLTVVDFGIAKSTDPDSTRLTGAGALIGTPEYMSPEQARGQEIDLRTDVYAVGIIAYQLLTGTVPFTGKGFMQVLMKHIHDPLPPASSRNPNVTPAMDDLLSKALAKERTDRFEDMRAFAAGLDEVDRTVVGRHDSLSGPQLPYTSSSGPVAVRSGGYPAISKRRVFWTVAATTTVVVVVVMAGAWAWWSSLG